MVHLRALCSLDLLIFDNCYETQIWQLMNYNPNQYHHPLAQQVTADKRKLNNNQLQTAEAAVGCAVLPPTGQQ